MKKPRLDYRIREIKRDLREYLQARKYAVGRIKELLEKENEEFESSMNVYLFAMKEIRKETPEYLERDFAMASIRDIEDALVKARKELKTLLANMNSGETDHYWLSCDLSTLAAEYEDSRKDGFVVYDTDNWQEDDDLPIKQIKVD